MKRIAALAAVMFGLLAIPTAALASTTSSGPIYPAKTVSFRSGACYYGFHRYHHHYRRYFDWWRRGREYTTQYCPFPQQIPLSQPQPQTGQCGAQDLVFTVAAGSSDMTEVSGPQLSPGEQFTYDGNTYTVMTINPGADQFTAWVNNFEYTNNSGAVITDATGVMACSSSYSSSSGYSS